MTHLSEDRIHDYVDRLLDDEARRGADRHLAECGPCRGEVERIRALVDDLAALPEEVLPARDLRPGIHARIEERRSIPLFVAGLGERTLRSLRYPLAAAVATLMVASAAATLLLVRGGPDRVVAAPPSAEAAAPALAQFRAMEEAYLLATAELQAALEVQRATLAPATAALVEENLRTIDRALREVRAALETDPANPVLTQLAITTYEQKLDLLRRATQVESL